MDEDTTLPSLISWVTTTTRDVVDLEDLVVVPILWTHLDVVRKHFAELQFHSFINAEKKRIALCSEITCPLHPAASYILQFPSPVLS